MLAVYLAMLETETDQQRFARLYTACEGRVYAVALRILGNPTQAEDAAQQTWYHLLRRWERVSALSWEEAGAYALTAAKNAAIDLLRAENRTVSLPDTWEMPARQEDQGAYQYLIALIQALPEGYRRILELKCVEEQSNREIARRTGLNESTVATRIMRGRAMLQERLREEGFLDGDLDHLLRRALLEANRLQFQEVLEDDSHPDFSRRYQQSRRRLLQNPFRWARERGRPLWRRTLQSAACLLLACAVAFAALAAASPTVRAAVFRWFKEMTETGVLYRPMNPDAPTLPPSWRPGWLPEGWTITDIYARDTRSYWVFEGDRGENGFLRQVSCICYSPASGDRAYYDLSEWDCERTEVGGMEADYYEGRFSNALIWEGSDGNLFWVQGLDTDRDTLQRIAESMTYYGEAALRYEAAWVPEGYEQTARFENIGVGQTDWFGRGDYLTFQYVTDAPCPLLTPDREWEAVTVNGHPARFWPNLVPEEQQGGGDQVAVGGATVTFGAYFGPEENGTLVWENGDTVFLLRGVLEKEELLRMAESIQPQRVQPEALP